MARARSADPIQQFRYRVEIEGVAQMGFSRVSGLESELEVAEYAEGGYASIHKLPGRERTAVATLERGATANLSLYNWYKAALTNGAFRKTVTIVEMDGTGAEIRRHTLYEAWASKFTRPELDATSSEVAIDTIEIQYESIETE